MQLVILKRMLVLHLPVQLAVVPVHLPDLVELVFLLLHPVPDPVPVQVMLVLLVLVLLLLQVLLLELV